MYEDDKKLAKEVLYGDSKALRAFFDRYYGVAYRYCLRRVSSHDAEELATEALRQAIRRIESYRGEAKLVAWILGITRNQLGSHFRKIGKHQNVVFIDDNEAVRAEVEAMAADLSDSPEYSHELAERQRLVHLMLDYLPVEYGKILEWKYIEGLSVDEIAEKLATSAIAIQSKLARARRAFKEHLGSIQTELAESLDVYADC